MTPIPKSPWHPCLRETPHKNSTPSPTSSIAIGLTQRAGTSGERRAHWLPGARRSCSDYHISASLLPCATDRSASPRERIRAPEAACSGLWQISPEARAALLLWLLASLSSCPLPCSSASSALASCRAAPPPCAPGVPAVRLAVLCAGLTFSPPVASGCRDRIPRSRQRRSHKPQISLENARLHISLPPRCSEEVDLSAPGSLSSRAEETLSDCPLRAQNLEIKIQWIVESAWFMSELFILFGHCLQHLAAPHGFPDGLAAFLFLSLVGRDMYLVGERISPLKSERYEAFGGRGDGASLSHCGLSSKTMLTQQKELNIFRDLKKKETEERDIYHKTLAMCSIWCDSPPLKDLWNSLDIKMVLKTYQSDFDRSYHNV
ncbi:hypothetical protein CB1_000853003 [Camelus ferus]|nr:hypothetical protein CB1_000853003 [Camelus ferus]